MRRARLAKFAAIHKENVGHINMPSKCNHPINYKRATQWIHSQCDRESVKFAAAIIDHTIHISFGEFVHNLNNSCSALVSHIKKSKIVRPILIIPFDTTKSNFWVSLLIWPQIEGILFDILPDITTAYNKYGADKESITCIVPDDCSYTGHQLSTYTHLDPARIKLPSKFSTAPEPSHTSKKWLDWSTARRKKTMEFETTIKRSDFSISLIVPFMSTLSRDSVLDHPFILISRSASIFQIFRNHHDVHDINTGIMREFNDTFQFHNDVSSIYFDHKIADQLSTFNKVYLLAPSFNCGKLRTSTPFIEGCTSRANIPKGIDANRPYTNIENEMTDVCPRTFYKDIKYTLNKKSICGVSIASLLDIHKERT
jgi:hypothetical protein